jgi:hypothetical protein
LHVVRQREQRARLSVAHQDDNRFALGFQLLQRGTGDRLALVGKVAGAHDAYVLPASLGRRLIQL